MTTYNPSGTVKAVIKHASCEPHIIEVINNEAVYRQLLNAQELKVYRWGDLVILADDHAHRRYKPFNLVLKGFHMRGSILIVSNNALLSALFSYEPKQDLDLSDEQLQEALNLLKSEESITHDSRV